MLKIGNRVITKTGRKGIIRFIGKIGTDTCDFIYTEWDDDKGGLWRQNESELNHLKYVPQEQQKQEVQNTKNPGETQEQGNTGESQPSQKEASPVAGEQTPKEAGESPKTPEGFVPEDYKIPEYTYNENQKSVEHHGEVHKEVENIDKMNSEMQQHRRELENDFDNKYKCPKETTDRLFYINRIKNILRDNTAERKVGGQKTGDLHFKKLWKVGLSDRLFQRKAIISKKKYNIALLVDCSGSMTGRRTLRAAQCAELFIKEFQKFCNISVATFDSDYQLVKPFGHNRYSDDDARKVAQFIHHRANYIGGSTNESTALREAIDSFKGMEGQNIIVSMCDGGPNNGDKVHHQIERARQKNISAIGIGIETDSVEYYYNLWASVNDPSDIYPAMTQTLSKAMKRMVS